MSNIMSVNFKAVKEVPSRIKMLSDVGRMKTYLMRSWLMLTGLLRCHLVPGLFHQLVFHAAILGFRDTVHQPYISTCFCGKLLLPLFLYFYEVQASIQPATTIPRLYGQHYHAVRLCKTVVPEPPHTLYCKYHVQELFMRLLQLNKYFEFKKLVGHQRP